MKFIVAYVEVGDSRCLKVHVSQLNGNSTLFNYRLTFIKARKLYKKPKLLTFTTMILYKILVVITKCAFLTHMKLKT